MFFAKLSLLESSLIVVITSFNSIELKSNLIVRNTLYFLILELFTKSNLHKKAYICITNNKNTLMTISLTKLSTKELAATMQRVIEASKKGNYKLSGSNTLLSVLEEEYAIYNEVFAKTTFSGKGKEVADADKQRDEAYNLIRNYLKHLSPMTLMPNYENAIALYNILKQLGLGLANLNYAEQTAQMQKLIETLDTDSNKALLTSLNLLPTFEDLKKKQEAFEKVYFLQAEANAMLRQSQSATSIRKNAEKALRDYLSYLTIFKNNEEFKTLYSDIREILKGVK